MTSQHRTKIGVIVNGKLEHKGRFDYHDEIQTFMRFYGLDTIKLNNGKKLFNASTHPKAKMENNYKLTLMENEYATYSQEKDCGWDEGVEIFLELNYHKENKTGYITFVSKNKLNMAQWQFKVVK